jgi:hypothetical protein
MRIRRNSNGFMEFSPEHLMVMHDRALDLGYSSDKPAPNWITEELTPNWDITPKDVQSGFNPPWLSGLSSHSGTGVPQWSKHVLTVWKTELRLWACDVGETVIPLWENWARETRPELVNVCREAVEASRAYIVNPTKSNKNKLTTASGAATRVAYADYYRYEHVRTTASAATSVTAASLAASAAANTSIVDAYNVTIAARAAATASGQTVAVYYIELYKRLDRVSPWWVGP